MEITRNTRLKDVIRTASGHDTVARLLYSLGLDLDLITNTPIGLLKLGALEKLSLGKISSSFMDAFIRILNSLGESEFSSEPGQTGIAWWKEAVFYQVYPRSFKDSNGDGIGDIKGIIEKLDYIKDLGADAVWCSPFFDSPNADNGYDIRDYRSVMAEFGTLDDVKQLIKECHDRDIRLIIDLVMNHTSDEHEWFRKALCGDEKYRGYYMWSKKPNNWTSFFSGSAWKYFPQTGEYALHLFADKQIDLNWDNPDVRKEMYDIGPGNGIMMSRMITGDDRGELSQLFSFDHIENPGKKRFDVYDFDLRKMVPELVRWQTEYSDHCWPTLFFENHDNPRICSKADHTGRYRVQISKLIAVLLFTLKGTPYVYQGGELGMTDYPFRDLSEYRDVESLNYFREKTSCGVAEDEAMKMLLYGSRDHARTPMQWSSGKNAGFSDSAPWIGVNPNYTEINAEAEAADPGSVLNCYRSLISLRKTHRTLIYGSFRKIRTSKDLLVYERSGDENFTVVINLTGRRRRNPFSSDSSPVFSNYPDSADALRPYEALIYRR